MGDGEGEEEKEEADSGLGTSKSLVCLEVLTASMRSALEEFSGVLVMREFKTHISIPSSSKYCPSCTAEVAV